MHVWSQSGSLYSRQGLRKYLTALERTRFIATAEGWPRRDAATLCLTLAYTGCRISEALALLPSSLQADAGFIAVRSLKKRGQLHIREIPAPPALFEVLHGYAGANPTNQLLWPMCRSHAWRLIKDVMAAASIALGIHATPKGLRHAYGLHAIRSNVPLNLLQRWLGHASMKTTAIYADAMGPEEQEIARRMWEANSPPN